MASSLISHKKGEIDSSSGLIKVVDSFEVDGSLVDERFLIKINDTPILVPDRFFEYLAILAIYRSRNGGWVDKEELEPGFNQSKHIYRIRKEIKKFLDSSCELINHRRGSYQLNVSPDRIVFNEQNLKNHIDGIVRNAFNSVYGSN